MVSCSPVYVQLHPKSEIGDYRDTDMDMAKPPESHLEGIHLYIWWPPEAQSNKSQVHTRWLPEYHSEGDLPRT